MLPPDFVGGYQWYLDALPSSTDLAPRIVVTVVVEGLEITALVDTGANQCILGWAVAEQLIPAASELTIQVRALGGNVHRGMLFPVVVTLLADDGDPVSLQIAAWSAETFNGPNLIGYGGVLERLRIALDPETNRFYFGS